MVKLRLLLNLQYSSVIIIVVAVGAGLYGLTYILPQFLSGITGYNALQSGKRSGALRVAGVGPDADPAQPARAG